jgi:site-specific DNA recombinase|nr:MAG TPA: integrase [Caudoviricetes sp.]
MPAIAKRERVAAYARVSCGKDAMLHSLSAQANYYSQYIQQNPAWEYAGVYVDEALTGTKDSRPEFQRMLADCKAGKIDRILTKSLSRFARNTVTVLESVRMLKSLGINVYFEEGNIHSLGADSELILTLLASFAQEESLSVSENQKWRIRKGFEQGEVMCWRFMLGYRIEHGKVEIDPDGAEIVRDIFRRAIAGETYGSICRRLNAQGKTGALGKPFRSAHIRDILTNEKYTGNALLQKTFVRDHLSKRQVANEGELPQYYATETHPAIIDEATFEAAQEIVRQHAERRKDCAQPQRSEFTTKIRCPFCGQAYKRVTSNGTVGWNCSTYQDKGKRYCRGKKIPEAVLKALVADVLELPCYEAPEMEAQIDHIEVPADNHLTFFLKNGHIEERIWKDRSRRESWTPEMKEKARQNAMKRKR